MWPEASINVPFSSETLSPVTVSLPPRSPALRPLTSSAPCTTTLLLPCLVVLLLPAALMIISPFFTPTLCAFSTPCDTIRLLTMSLPAAAVRAILPPSASITPVFAISCDFTSSDTATLISPSPCISTVAVSPEARCARPIFAVIMPSFTTLGATKPTSPASLAVMVPSFVIVASALPFLSKVSVLLFMNLSLLISAVVATMPFTSTVAFFPNITPFWLTITTLPLAVSFPLILLGLLLFTRLRAMALLLG